jgi:hypothetical protein
MIRVHLRDTVTGTAGVHVQAWPHDDDALRYQFTDGNYGCDCNRSNFLCEAGGDDLDLPCNGAANRIIVEKIEDEHGRVLYRDEGAA